MIGTTVSHYSILAPLGRGGMGVVYRAEDTRLGRPVALKFLPDALASDREAVERFSREARAASSLNHPHVCAVYDIGEHEGRHFIVMELLEGRTLHEEVAGRALQVDRIVELGVQITDALAAAHAAGIVHRDIKPANVFVTERGTAKLLDFGLAKPSEDSGSGGPHGHSAAPTSNPLTRSGTVVGTVAYMSPEQVRGEALDARSDLFSLGAVLYEMATGRQPFPGATAGSVHDGILNRTPSDPSRENPALPARLAEIIARALEKDRALRYQNAADLRADLQRVKRDRDSAASVSHGFERTPPRRPGRRAALVAGLAAAIAIAIFGARLWLAPGRGAAIDSIAVLPFVNADGSPDAEYLSDGITESLIRDLTELPSLRVSARSHVFRYKGQDVDPQKVGQDLGVRAVLSGRLLQRDDTVVVRTELTDVSDGSQLWGGEYSSKTTNIFELQGSLSREISQRLRLRLTSDQKERLTRPHTASNDAYRLYLQGRYQWNKRSRAGALKAIEFLTQAVAADPRYALAYAALSDAYNMASFFNAFPPRDAMPKAKAAAARALEIDPGLAEAHISLSYASFTYDWDWGAATTHMEQARRLNAPAVDNHTYYTFYLAIAGRHAEAIEAARRASAADPVSASLSHGLAVQFSLAGRHDDSIREAQRTIDLDAGFAIAYQVLAGEYGVKGLYREALAAAEQAVALERSNPVSLALLARVRARAGDRPGALAVVAELEESSRTRYMPGFALAVAYAGLGDHDKAFAALERAYEERFNRLAYLRMDPLVADLRDDPRFDDLLRRIGLPR